MTNNKKDYKALSIIEAIRTRPGMYIGSNENPNHLLIEVLDNCLDEITNGFATNCYININEGNCQIFDNGRGFQIYQMELPSGEYEDSVVALCTIPHSGSKFDNEDYNQLIGMNGVGLVAVNALTDYLIIQSKDRNNKNLIHTYNFQNAELVSKTDDICQDDNVWTTCVQFKPTTSRFKNNEFELRPIIDRLLLTQAKYPYSNFFINNKEIPKYTLEKYVKATLKIKEDELVNYVKYVKDDFTKIELFLAYSTDPETIILGDVNLRNCDGTYLTSSKTLIKNCVISKIEKRYKDVSANLLLLGLRLYVSLTVPEPQFADQTKTKMTLDVKHLIFGDNLTNRVTEIIKKPEVMSIITRNVNRRLSNNLIKSKTTNKKISATNKLVDCINTPGDVLYLLEGDSAMGPIKQIRNKYTEAAFPLKGKVLNVETANIDKIKNNKEINQLIEALGPLNNRRYEKIKILADADSVSAETVIYYINNNNVMFDQIQNLENQSNIGYIESLNKKTGKCELKKILKVISHDYDKDEIWRIKFIGNYEDLTDDHVIYVFDTVSNQIIEKSPTQINIKTDYLVKPKSRIVTNKSVVSINITDSLIQILPKNNHSYILVDIDDFMWDTDNARIDISNRIDYKNITRKKLSQLSNINYQTLQMYCCGRDNTFAPVKKVCELMKYTNINLQETKVKIKLTKLTKHYLNKGIFKSTNIKNIRHIINIDENIAYLLGQYIGDGNHGSSKNNPYEIHFHTGNGKFKNDLINTFKLLNYDNYVEDFNNDNNNLIIKLKSLEFCAILDKLGLNRKKINKYKFIPNIIFTCNKNIRLSLLKGLYHSDGTLFEYKNRFRFSYSTNSDQLKNDIQFLLYQLECNSIISNISPKKGGFNKKGYQINHTKNAYHININKSKDLIKILTIFENDKQNQLNNIHNNCVKRNIGIIPINDYFEGVKIKSIEKIKYNYDKVYDLEVENNNNFACGTSGIIIHNSDGHHIVVLLILLLEKFANDYIKSNNASVIMPPLYGAVKNKQYIPIYDETEISLYKNQGYNIMRFKGLGEMSGRMLRTTLDSEFEWILKYPDNSKKLEALKYIITNTSVKHKLLNDDRININNLFKSIKNNKGEKNNG